MADAYRLERYMLRALAAQLLPKERVHHCGIRYIGSPTIRIKTVAEKRRAHYGNIMRCASVWHCADCSFFISTKRAKVIADLIDRLKKDSWSVSLITYTVRHKKSDALAPLIGDLRGALRKMMATRAYAATGEKFGFLGVITSLEVTWGKNGFHPHIHAILFHKRGLEKELTQALTPLYVKAIGKVGRFADTEVAVKVTQSGAKIGDYVAKQGRTRPKWTIANEIASQGHKKSRSQTTYTMTDLLWAWAETGQMKYADLWLEYARAVKGKRHIYISPSLEAYSQEAQATDESIIADEVESGVMIATIDPIVWHYILSRPKRHLLLAELLDLAEASDEALALKLADLYQRAVDSQAPL